MDVPLYDVYLTGNLAEGVTPALAGQRLAALFKSTPEAMAGLITGKAQLLKRGVDKNTAIKYRDALQNVGCEATFKAQTNAPKENAPIISSPAVSTTTTTATVPPSTMKAPATPNSGLQLTPAGDDLLRPEERHHVAAVRIETSHLSVAPVGPLPSTRRETASVPDTSRFSLAAAGSDLLDESERAVVPAIVPDTSDLSVAEIGAPIETLKTEAAPLNPDTSGLNLAPAGVDLLTEAERKHEQAAAPNTDHIKLAP